MNMDIDLVLPYVDMTKDAWKKTYEEINKKLRRHRSEDNRYRQLLDLKYLLRCINKFCPFIRTLWLVVQTRDQVPDYIKESEHLKIVEHKQIIPKDLLPTYNSGTIECHIAKIPDLAEHFIYINDDMYPLKEMKPTDFFTEEGVPKIYIKLKNQMPNTYRTMLKNSEIFVKKLLGINQIAGNTSFYRDGHSWTPMLKSNWEHIYSAGYDTIKEACTTFRDGKNLVQQICTYYSYFSGNYAQRELTTKYWDFKKSINDLFAALSGDNSLICINDSGLTGDTTYFRKRLKSWFIGLVPDKSEKYEI